MFLSQLYSDNHLIAIDKPAGLASQGSSFGQTSCEQGAEELCRMALSQAKGKKAYLQIVSRLDRPVSGVLLFASSSKALARLQKAQRDRLIKRRYFAVVEGVPKRKQAICINYIEHDEKHHCAKKSNRESGKRAELSYSVVQASHDRALLAVEPVTGRYHQIRLQLALLGHPIWGDAKYGCNVFFHEGMIALHCASAQLHHPVSGANIIIEAPLPNNWGSLI